MPRKTKIIFITVFVIVGAIVLGIYFSLQKSNTSINGTDTTTGYEPFSSGSTTNPLLIDGSTETGGQGGESTAVDEGIASSGPSRFHQITALSVAGAVFFEDTRPVAVSETALIGGEEPGKTTAKAVNTKVKAKVTPPAPKFEIVPAIRYVERVTGHIHEMYLDTKAKGEVSNSTIPTIYEALFDGKASSVIYRYLGDDGQTITTFLATLGSAKGEFLPSDILDVSISPDKTKFFYLTKTASGVTGTIRSFKDTKRTQVWSSSLSELLSQWVTDQKVYLTTKAASSVNGDLFSLNISSGVLTKVLGGIKGLTTLANSDGSLILYSTSTSGGPKLGLFDVKNHTMADLNLYGLPEKCVWGNTIIYCAIPNSANGSGYPDNWYQGTVSFDDNFVKIDSKANNFQTIADSASGTSVDGTHLFLDKTATELFFINKKDSSLWSLDL